jgi:NAD(P)-dependent dehydrogenase (short-subunit alcohol dehydrogenase family)
MAERTAVWISGASSGIGAALATSVPYANARVIGIGRRAPAAGEHLEADLGDPGTWPGVAAHFDQVLGSGQYDRAVFIHMSGIAAPAAQVVEADPAEYTAAVLLNSASGQVLGQAFLSACRRAGVQPTLCLCSSPAAANPAPSASHYGAGKAALQYWAAAAALETDGWAKVFSVIPFAVDTPMVRGSIADLPPGHPIGEHLRSAADEGRLATAEATAQQIWSLATDNATHGAAVPVGAVPAGVSA